MKVLLNIIWLVLCGFWMAIGYAVAGIVCCILIITIPFGVASFRIAGYALWPFGRTTVRKPTAGFWSALGNVIWVLVAGIWLAIGHVVRHRDVRDDHRHPARHRELQDGADLAATAGPGHRPDGPGRVRTRRLRAAAPGRTAPGAS